MGERHPRRPLPSPVYATNYEDMRGRRIVAAYSMCSFVGPVPAHTCLAYVTDTGRVIITRGGAEKEPRAEHFGSVVGPAASARFGTGSMESTHDMGRLLVTTQELAEVAPRTAPGRSPEEDRHTFTLDTVNFLQVVQGQGIAGLRPRSNVVITRITDDPARAQLLFNAALEVNQMLDRAEFAYAIFPQPDGRTGINSHTVSSLIAERADEIARAAGIRGTGFLPAVGRQSSLLTGSSTARWPLTGPDYHTVYGLTNAQFDGRADRGRWSAEVHLRRRQIPRDHLMPPSQGILPPRTGLDPRLVHLASTGSMDGADDMAQAVQASMADVPAPEPSAVRATRYRALQADRLRPPRPAARPRATPPQPATTATSTASAPTRCATTRPGWANRAFNDSP
jgi:hypothetical protein